MTSAGAAGSVEAVFREERGRLLAMLVRQFGDLDLAEDAASDAIEAALERWPAEGVPTTPLAWLLTTARRKAVDRLRRDKAYAARLAIMQVEAQQHLTAVPGMADLDVADAREAFPDERLRLFFTCCHPALSPGGPDRADAAVPCRAVHPRGGARLPGAGNHDGAADRPG